MPYFELFQLLASSAYNQAFITRSMNYWLYDREYVYPRIAKGLCRGQWLEGVQQGAERVVRGSYAVVGGSSLQPSQQGGLFPVT